MIAWIASVLGIVGALLVAGNISQSAGFAGYILFTLSATAWCYVAHQTKQNQLLIMNTIFLAINIFGIVNWA